MKLATNCYYSGSWTTQRRETKRKSAGEKGRDHCFVSHQEQKVPPNRPGRTCSTDRRKHTIQHPHPAIPFSSRMNLVLSPIEVVMLHQYSSPREVVFCFTHEAARCSHLQRCHECLCALSGFLMWEFKNFIPLSCYPSYPHKWLYLLIKGSLVEKLPIYEQDRRVIAQPRHSSVKS